MRIVINQISRMNKNGIFSIRFVYFLYQFKENKKKLQPTQMYDLTYPTNTSGKQSTLISTRRLVNVRLHMNMMFQPELIYIFD